MSFAFVLCLKRLLVVSVCSILSFSYIMTFTASILLFITYPVDSVLRSHTHLFKTTSLLYPHYRVILGSDSRRYATVVQGTSVYQTNHTQPNGIGWAEMVPSVMWQMWRAKLCDSDLSPCPLLKFSPPPHNQHRIENKSNRNIEQIHWRLYAGSRFSIAPNGTYRQKAMSRFRRQTSNNNH